MQDVQQPKFKNAWFDRQSADRRAGVFQEELDRERLSSVAPGLVMERSGVVAAVGLEPTRALPEAF